MTSRAGHDVRDRACVVIGVGNPFRRDDGAGHAVIERVSAELERSLAVRVGEGAGGAGTDVAVRLLALDGEPSRLIDAWTGASLAIVVDAVRSGGRPGSVQRIEVAPGGRLDESWLPPRAAGSTHGTGVAEAIALGRALGRVPDRLVVYAIEGADFGAGPGVSCEVEGAVAEVATRVLGELA